MMKSRFSILAASVSVSLALLTGAANACPHPFLVTPGLGSKNSAALSNSYEDNVGYYECSANGICYLMESEFDFSVGAYPEPDDDVIVGLGANTFQAIDGGSQKKNEETIKGVGDEQCTPKLPAIVSTGSRSGGAGVLRLSTRYGGTNSGGPGGGYGGAPVASGKDDKNRGCSTNFGQLSCEVAVPLACSDNSDMGTAVLAALNPDVTQKEYYVTVNHPNGSTRWVVSYNSTSSKYDVQNISESCN